MKPPKYLKFRFGVVLAIGALVALALCIQCVRTYFYTESVLVPQQAEREAERQAGALTAAVRSAGMTDPHALGPALEHTLEASSDRVLWMRILDPQSDLIVQSGNPQGSAKVPSRWWERLEKHENLGVVVETPAGQAYVAMLPFRLPRPPKPPSNLQDDRRPLGPPPHPGGYVIELAIPLKAVANSFAGLRQNLIIGVVASLALLLALGVIAFRAPHYLRGQYLEGELHLARRVQHDLLPKAHTVSNTIEFDAAAIAADQVGGDFYDVFEAESGKVSIVLGDVSGKGVPAALLASVLQGAIRSSTACQHERACEQINRMLTERTACERYATLFWALFDPFSSTLRYVNAGHAAPMLVRDGQTRIERLKEGGPVLGLLPKASYIAGTVKILPGDKLVLYSDGINEAANPNQEEFGDNRIAQVITASSTASASQLCDSIMCQIQAFSDGEPAQDDRTLLVVQFPQSKETWLPVDRFLEPEVSVVA